MKQDNCDRCRFFKLVNVATRDGKIIGWFCGNCFDLIDHDVSSPSPPLQDPSWRNNNDSSFDNVIRNYEEDR